MSYGKAAERGQTQGSNEKKVVNPAGNDLAQFRVHEVAEWFKYVKNYCDWLVATQRENGSFPSTYQGPTGEARGNLGSATYAAVPVLVRMTEETGDKKYLDSAIKAADYVWTAYGSKCVFCGAAGGDTADKEPGMLSAEALLALYENNKDAKWLQRAETAGSYAES